VNRSSWRKIAKAGIGLLKKGQHAPEFTARLSNGRTVRLSDYRGKQAVVLSFYPKDFTPGCTRQACSYRDSYGLVRELGAVILGVSTDGEEQHERFASSCRLPYPLISDPEQRLCAQYGATRFGFSFLPTRRVTYVIDKEGIIRLVSHHEVAIQRHIEDILETLRDLQRSRAD
jgi:peroxiredoxin Q/BCP